MDLHQPTGRHIKGKAHKPLFKKKKKEKKEKKQKLVIIMPLVLILVFMTRQTDIKKRKKS